MKKNFRFVLFGVYVLIVGISFENANAQVFDTAEVCVSYNQKSFSLLNCIQAVQFPLFRQSDSMAIVERGNSDTLLYTVSYRLDSLQFLGNGVSPSGMLTISGYRNQYAQCKVFYTRTIEFNFKPPFFSNDVNSDSSVAHWKRNLFGLKDFDSLKTVLKSTRNWQCIVRIRKSLPPNETFAIAGDTCMLDNVKLRIPDQYADMKCRWACERYVAMLNSSKAHEVTISRRNVPFLTTLVTCTLSGCDDKDVSSSIRLRTKYTPASELTFNDCLPTASKSITVKASNPMPGVHYEWVGLSVVREISSDSMSETISYPAPGSDNFTIKLNTLGGCLPDKKEVTVHRKIGSDVKLLVTDSCLAAGIPFHMETDPQLPKMDLTWSVPTGCRILNQSGSGDRKDRVIVIRDAGLGQSALITVTVRDKVCEGFTSEYVSIEGPMEMIVKTETGSALSVGGQVPSGTKIIFTAPRHSSITGLYGWSTSIDGSLSKSWNGPAEISVTAPDSGSLTVSVSYTSCFGRQSKTYRLQATNGYCTLLEE